LRPQPSGDDIVLAAGDTLYVGKAPQFYIDGQAQKPGAHRLERGMTVRQALGRRGRPHGARQPKPAAGAPQATPRAGLVESRTAVWATRCARTT
jgi:hypothetical protein